MPPKKETKKEDTSLTAVVVVDSFDKKFHPFVQSVGPWCLQQLCNVPIIDYTLSWILRTEARKVILIVSEKHHAFMESVEKAWKHSFASLSVISCKNAMSVGDSLRELDGRGLVTGDFLLVTNPATITSSTLAAQISKYRERRREDRNNVMTLIYSQLENSQNAVIGVEKETNKLRLYHRHDDVARLDVDKPNFIEDAVIRRDVVDSGIAICSVNIAAQFSDNFDFQQRDDVIREILVNEELLLQSIHVEVLPENEAALTVIDYPTFLLASSLLMERWFFPIVPDRMVIGRSCGFTARPGNIYSGLNDEDIGRLSPTGCSTVFSGCNVSMGTKCEIGNNVEMNCVTIGKGTVIGNNCRLSNCVVGDDCVVGADSSISKCVLGSGVTIPAGTSIKEETIIAANVSFPTDFEFPANTAICCRGPGEDEEEAIKTELISDDVHVWSLADGSSMWVSGRKKIVTSDLGDEEYNSDSESGSEASGPVELDSVGQFLEEVVESMERIQELTFSKQQMNNLILEINSSKLAYNISMEDVAKNVFFAFLGLPGNETVAGIKELALKWKHLFVNYYQPMKSQIQLLMGLEERYKQDQALYGPKMAKIVHTLYMDVDVLEQEAILEWAESLSSPDMDDLKKRMQPIIDWLQDDDDDEEEDSD